MLLAQLKTTAGLTALNDDEYAAWIERPEIRKAIAAQEELRARIRRAEDDARAERYIQRLEAVLDNAKDLTNDAQRADTRRAASLLYRMTFRPSPMILPGVRLPGPAAALRERAGAPAAAPAPTNARPAHEAPAHLSQSRRGDLTSSPVEESPRRPHPITSSPVAESPGRPHPPEPILDHPASPCSAFPGLTTAVTEFLATLVSSGGAPAALPLVAAHIKNRRGHGAVLTWLDSIRATIHNTDPRPGTFIYDDDYDTAVHHVALSGGASGGTGPGSGGPVRGTDGPAPSGAPVSPAPDGSVPSALISCVLERDRDQVPARWAITGFTVADTVTADSS